MQYAVVDVEPQNPIFWKGVPLIDSNEVDFCRLGNPCGLDGSISKAFFAALLLTQSTQKAEAAVMEAIHLLNADESFDDAILRGVVDASIKTSSESLPVSQLELQAACAGLPVQLHAVLGLSPNFRHCFVLRILLQLSRETCAGVLKLSTADVDQFTCEALWTLPAYQAHADRPAGSAVLLKKGRSERHSL
jgi:hypothetical protein